MAEKWGYNPSTARVYCFKEIVYGLGGAPCTAFVTTQCKVTDSLQYFFTRRSACSDIHLDINTISSYTWQIVFFFVCFVFLFRIFWSMKWSTLTLSKLFNLKALELNKAGQQFYKTLDISFWFENTDKNVWPKKRKRGTCYSGKEPVGPVIYWALWFIHLGIRSLRQGSLREHRN